METKSGCERKQWEVNGKMTRLGVQLSFGQSSSGFKTISLVEFNLTASIKVVMALFSVCGVPQGSISGSDLLTCESVLSSCYMTECSPRT